MPAELSAAEIAIDAFPAITGAEQIGVETLKAANTILTAYQAPDIKLDKVQMERLAAAKAIVAAVEKHDTAATQAKLGSLSAILVLCLTFALSGCGPDFLTIAPDHHDASASIDSSTPTGYTAANGSATATSGVLGYHDARAWLAFDGQSETNGNAVVGIVFGVLTPNGPAIYNHAMAKYAAQLDQYFNVLPVPVNAGISPWTDDRGNKLWKIDVEHTQYFLDAADIASNPALYPLK